MDFSLRKILPILETYRAPAGEFAAGAAHRRVYRLFSLGKSARAAGELVLSRGEAAEGRFDLSATCRRLGHRDGGGHCFTRARFRCREDALATPESWEAGGKIAPKGDAPARPFTEISASGRYAAGEVTLDFGGKRRTRPAGDSFSAKWALVEAVQRLPGGFGDASFACLDEFDAVLAGHRLEGCGGQEVSTAGGALRLRGFLHTGAAMIPRHLWVRADTGLLLFVTTGTEVAILGEVDGRAATFEAAYEVAKVRPK